MQLFEWGIASKAAGRPGPRPVGITDTAIRAQDRMLEALRAVPAGVLARGWVTGLALGSDRLTYDRLDTLVRVTRNAHGRMRWLATVSEAAAAGTAGQVTELVRLPPRTAVIDGRQLRELRRARGLSQENLAWAAGLGLTTVARLERQPRPPCRFRTVTRLAEALGENPRAMVSALPPDRG